jgi:DNA-binding transcriptional ArsR family regulator
MELSIPELEVLKGLESLRNPSTADEISNVAGKSRSRTASLLNVLERKGLTISERMGIKTLYKINEAKYLEIRRDKDLILRMETLGILPKVTDTKTRRILFDFRNDTESVLKLKRSISALKSMVRSYSIEEKELAIKSYLVSLTTVVKGFWEITKGVFTNFDFDLVPMRFDPEFIDGVSDVIISRYSEKLDCLNGLVCFVGSNNLGTRSFTSESYVKNSLPITLAVALKKNIPIIVVEIKNGEKRIFGEITEHGYYGVIDDAPVRGETMAWANKKIDELNGIVFLNLMIINRNDFVSDFLHRNNIGFE